MNEIHFSNIVKTYVNTDFKLDINDLFLNKRESVSFIGTNGSGKTTMMRLICGFTIQNKGTISVLKEDNASKNNKYNCRFVLESGKGYYDYLTAQENIEYFLTLNKINIQKESKSLKELVEYFNFDSELKKKTKALSQGNRQKMSLIIALMTKPKILCLDEPTNGLDINTTNKLINILKHYKEIHNMTILFTSHDIHFIRSLSDRAIIMNKGQIVRDTRQVQDILKNRTVYNIELKLEDYDRFINDAYNSNDYTITIHDNYFLIQTSKEKIRNNLLQNFAIIGLNQEETSTEKLFEELINYEL